ncbi:MAG: type II toxin-antitoxin system RelE/ParE family toxin [Verrucomicrobiae bacterium]|nr:type II toxin-antitoxin system RelE/ParE family toxin [Verrucomicrobiae bacterium]
MEIEFANQDLDRLETDADFNAGCAPDIVRAYRRRVQSIRAAVDERDLYAVKGNRFEKLKGNRSHQRSIRLNDQWRLIVEIKQATPKNIIVILAIEDYH